MSATNRSPARMDDVVQTGPVEFRMTPLTRLKLPRDLCAPCASASTDLPGESLILPLVVVASNTSRRNYTIVDGHKRYAALRKQGRTEAACCVLGHPLNENALGILRIRLNHGRQFTVAEKITLLRWLTRNLDKSHIDMFIAEIGITTQEASQMAPLMKARHAIVQAVMSDRIHLSVLRPFLLMPNADQDCFLATFAKAHLSLQTQREFLEWITEIAYEKRTRARDILNGSDIQDIISNGRLNWPQRIQKIRDVLYRQKFPRLARAEEEWTQRARSANPSKRHVTFIPSPSFEKNRLDVRISVSAAPDARRIFGALAALPESQWQKLICPLDC